MTDIINAYFKRFYPTVLDPAEFREFGILPGMIRYEGINYSTIFPRIVCTDGFSMSVQAYFGAYSTPRNDFAEHYSHVEVGFPSAPEPLLMDWAETPSEPTDTVYGYVPISVVVAVIEKHGGMKDDQT